MKHTLLKTLLEDEKQNKGNDQYIIPTSALQIRSSNLVRNFHRRKKKKCVKIGIDEVKGDGTDGPPRIDNSRHYG
jgi:hypothetical protein